MVSGGKRKPTGVVIWFVTELMCNLTNLAISSLFSFYFFPSFLSGKPKKDCSLDLAPLTSQALMDKKQWVWMSNWCCSGRHIFLLIIFCFPKHCVVCLSSLLFKRRWRSKTTQNHGALFLQEERLSQVDKNFFSYASQGVRRKWLELWLPEHVLWLFCIPVFLEEELKGEGEIQAEKEQCCHHNMQEELCGFIAVVLCVFCFTVYYTDTYDVQHINSSLA